MTKQLSEKYLKRLFRRRADIEDALKRLDGLTQEEYQMAAAQILKAAYTVDDTGRVGRDADIAFNVDSRVVGIDERVANMDERVAGVDARVAVVDKQAKFFDDKLVAVIDGA